MRIKFTPSARLRFLSAVQYIRQDDALAAVRFRKNAERILRRLGPHPDSGRKIPEFPELPHREVIVAPYRFFYRVDQSVVWIVAVWHGAQLPAAPDVQAPDPKRARRGPRRKPAGGGRR